MKTTAKTKGQGKVSEPKAIQTWPAAEAPSALSALLDGSAGYEWVALVPAELNDPEVLSLLLRNTGNDTAETRELADGSLLLAGYFAAENRPLLTHHAQPPAKARRARSGGS